MPRTRRTADPVGAGRPVACSPADRAGLSPACRAWRRRGAGPGWRPRPARRRPRRPRTAARGTAASPPGPGLVAVERGRGVRQRADPLVQARHGERVGVVLVDQRLARLRRRGCPSTAARRRPGRRRRAAPAAGRPRRRTGDLAGGSSAGSTATAPSPTISTPAGGRGAATLSCAAKTRRTVSSLMPSVMAWNMSKPSRWYSTSGLRWAIARRPMPSCR